MAVRSAPRSASAWCIVRIAVLDVPELLAQADQALYHAKERGRNRVEIASLEMLLARKTEEQAVQAASAPVAAKTAA